ncbi:MAG: RNA polymerase sigma factor [Cryomorphaceae bacterium]
MQKETFAELVLSKKDKMFRFALSYLKCDQDAKDVVQDVLIKLWETRHELNEKRNLEAWCMTMVKNKSMDALKRVGRKMKSDWNETALNTPLNSENPLEVTANKESLKHVMEIVDELPVSQRDSFNLRDVQGYSYIEIAEILDMNMSQVKVNIFRARKTIQEKLIKVYNYG